MLALWKKKTNYNQPRQHIKNQRHYFADKVCLVKAMVFPVVMHGCESWAIKKAEHRRIDAFELWCCRKLLRIPWTARRSNQSILKEICPEHSLTDAKVEVPILRPPDVKKRSWWWKRLKTGGEGYEEWDGWKASLTQWTWVWASSGSWWCTGKPGVLQFMGSQSWMWLSDWTKLIWLNNRLLTLFLQFLCTKNGNLHYSVRVLVAKSCLTLGNLVVYSCQSLLSMEVSRQEYWSG